jgi:hypothetical protein
MKKGYWVVAYRSISDASAVKAYGPKWWGVLDVSIAFVLAIGLH